MTGNHSFTLEGWFRSTGTTQNQALVDMGTANTGNIVGLTTWTGTVGSSAPSKLGLDTYYSSNFWDTSSVGVNIWDGQWHYLAVTYDAAADRVTGYVDGQSLGTQTPTALNLGASNIRLGYWVDTSVNQPFIGDADEIAVYPSALSAARIAAHYQASGRAAPQNTSPPIISGAPTVSSQLGCSTGSWTNSPTSYAYQWNRDGTPITGAATSTYTVQPADSGHALSCTVTATNDYGSSGATSIAVLVPSGQTTTATAAPTALDFGVVAYGTGSADAKLTLTNTGAAGLNVTQVVAQGSHQAAFSPGPGSCPQQGPVAYHSAGPFVLAPGASCQLDIGFAPQVLGVQTAQLVISANVPGGQIVVPLKGTGALRGSIFGTVVAPGPAGGPVDPLTGQPYPVDLAGAEVEVCPRSRPSPSSCHSVTTTPGAAYGILGSGYDYAVSGLPAGSYLVKVTPPDASLFGASGDVVLSTANLAAGNPGVEQDFALHQRIQLPAGYSVTSPLGTFNSGVPAVDWSHPFGLHIPTIISPTEPPRTTATFSVKLTLTSLVNNTNPNVSPGFTATETIPFTLTYDKYGHPVITAGSPDTNWSSGMIGLDFSPAQVRALRAVGVTPAQLEQSQFGVGGNPNIWAIQGNVTGPGTCNSPGAAGGVSDCSPTVTTNQLVQQEPGQFANPGKLVATINKVARLAVTRYNMDISLDLAALVKQAVFPFGDLQLEIQQSYNDSAGHALSADAVTGLYVDPSGVVETTTGIPLRGARVVLERSDKPSGPFVAVANGSSIMSPDNRRNPDRTNATGLFAWDVLPGYYRVSASHPGCRAPGRGTRRSVAVTRVLPIPPPVSGLVIKLACPGMQRTATQTTVVVIHGGHKALQLIGALVKPLHRRGPLSGDVTFRRGARVLAVVPVGGDGAELLLPPGQLGRISASYSGDSRFAPSRGQRS